MSDPRDPPAPAPRPSVPGPEPVQPAPPGAPRPGTFEHYKGASYRVIDLARHSETEEWLVLYRPLYGEGGLWARPLAMFTETVATAAGPRPRFRRTGD